MEKRVDEACIEEFEAMVIVVHPCTRVLTQYFLVHGDIRHLEMAWLAMLQSVFVHGDIRHLEKINFKFVKQFMATRHLEMF